jgi:hypothetical protein
MMLRNHCSAASSLFFCLILWTEILLASVLVKGNDDACGLYLAKSSIPNAGLGVFAARDFKIGERLVSYIYFATINCDVDRSLRIDSTQQTN